MNFYKTSFILFILSLPLLGLNCGEKDPEPVYYLSQEFKDYVVFPVESYWVYESGINESDTVYLYNQEFDIITKNNNVSHDYERLMQHFTSSYFNDTLAGGGPGFFSDEGFFVYSQFFISNFLATSKQFISGKDTGYTFFYNQYIKTKYEAYYDSLQVNNTWYKEVRLFAPEPEMDPRLPKRVWYARHVGVIKKELYNGQVWELKEYYIP